MGAGRLRPPSEFDPDREGSFHLRWSRFGSWKLAPDLMSTTRSVWFFVIALTVIRLSMLATTDLEFDEAHYWLAAMFTFWLALERSPCFSWHWPLTGLLVGLGFLSKYTNALELVSIMLVLVLARRLRQEFARPGLYLLLGVFGLCTIPPIVW